MLFFDTETNGLLHEVTTLHVLVVKCLKTGERKRYFDALPGADGTLKEGLQRLEDATKAGVYITGHNAIKYDVPVLEKLYPSWSPDKRFIIDTLVIARLIFSDIGDRDNKLMSLNEKLIVERRIKQGEHAHGEDFEPLYEDVVVQPEFIRFPGKLWGRHSLKAWGWRLGIHKGTFAEDTENAWAVLTPEMVTYCEQDVDVLQVLYMHLTQAEYSQMALDLEHQTAWFCARMERSGWPFNEKGAAALYGQLVVQREEIRQQMLKEFEPIVIKRVSEKTGKPLKDKVIEFNPGSRKQIAERLIAKYGWQPKEFTPSGEAKVDEDVLKKLKYPEAQLLANYFLLEKRTGQLGEGEQAWLKLVRNGHIHGSVNTNGAVTGRATHAGPNLAQVPSVRAVWGPECRSLFTVRPGFRMVGSDLSGLELRCLAHFMSKWDGGEYIDTLLNGDVHTKNQLAAGLPTRDNAKTFIYAFLYGAGDEKIGSIVGKGRAAGKKLREAFLAQTPALAQLKKAVTQAAKRGHLVGLDGRKLPIRSEHAALNTLLQSAGALISKRWLVEFGLECDRRGWKYGWDGDYTVLGWIHDEVQIAARVEIADEIGKVATECAKRAGEFFKMKCPIAAEFKVGDNWKDTH